MMKKYIKITISEDEAEEYDKLKTDLCKEVGRLRFILLGVNSALFLINISILFIVFLNRVYLTVK